MSNKCTLIIDGNWLLMSRMAKIKDHFDKNLHTIEELNTAKEDLKDFMAKSISVQLRRFDNLVDNIILVTDGGSWRRTIERPVSQPEEYKSNRVREENIAWNYIFDSLNELKDRFDKLGITACNIQNIEGDDWIWWWSTYLNSQNINCMIWSSDADLKQLVTGDADHWTVWYNDISGLYIHKALNTESESDIDFFMNQNYRSHLLESIEDAANKKITYINPAIIVMEKVICGDAGDNILPIIREEINGKTYRFTPKLWESLREQINITTIEQFVKNRDIILHNIIQNLPKRFNKNIIDKQTLKEEFDYNLNMVWLSKNVIPDTIKSACKSIEYKQADLSQILNNYEYMVDKNKEEIEDLIEGLDLPF